MKKNLKKLLSLALVVALTGSLFTACTPKDQGSSTPGVQTSGKKLGPLTKDEITLTYTFWQDIEISEKLKTEWETLYPNIKVELKQFEVGSNNAELQALAVTGDLPDCFWVLGSPDVFITNALLYDMKLLWEADANTEEDSSANVIKGINEYKIGYLGTDSKWTTPVKFFPTTAFVNLDVFIRNNEEMPAKDWTWDEFEETVERMTMQDKTDGSYIYGTTTGCTVITWYPIASDKECIGEFGWNGTEYDMENWAYGMNLEAKWINNGNKPHYLGQGGEEELAAKYGEGVLYPQDIGNSAIHCDNWWTWEDFWITDPWIVNEKVIFVPYLMPHTEEAQGGNYIATMDMGGISPFTDYPREAYELLKFMTWGAQGWEFKIKHYPDCTEESTGNDRAVSKNHCPITLDKEVWDAFEKWHPNSTTGDDKVVGLYGEEYDRSEYFDYFMDEVQKSTWVCYGGQQIPGFDTWLQNIYFGNDGQQDYNYDGGLGIEQAVINGGVDALDFYQQLQESGNKINKEKLQEIEDYLQ